MNHREDFPLQGKLYFRIPLKLASPLIIGSGDNTFTDVDVQVEIPSGKPLIPATSLIGVFRHFTSRYFTAKPQQGEDEMAEEWSRQIDYLFGESSGNGAQSALLCDDIVLDHGEIGRRDGVAISPDLQTALDEKKYEYQIVESPEVLYINLEITMRSLYDRDSFIEIMHQIIKGIAIGMIRLGAKTNKGFGRLELAGPIEWDELNFSRAADIVAWLTNSMDFKKQDWQELKTTRELPLASFEIDARFYLRDSLLIRAYPDDPQAPDAVSIRQGARYTLPGTSLMGVIRHRSRKIMKSWGYSEELIEQKMHTLFGHVPDTKPAQKQADENSGACVKGRLLVEEYPIEAGGAGTSIQDILQTRIKIDRFTGGTFEGALIQEMPLYQTDFSPTIRIRMMLPPECQDWEAKVLLLVLKDLWTGDLAIGGEKNVGRGLLQGIDARVTWQSNTYLLEKDEEGFIKQNDDFKRLNAKFAETH